VAGGGEKNAHRYNLYPSPNITRVIKSKRTRRVYVACMEIWEMHAKFWSEILLEELSVDEGW